MKAIALVLAILGFVSYIYEHYLDDLRSKSENGSGVSQFSLVERGKVYLELE